MQALPSCDQLSTPEDQVKGVRVLWPARLWIGIEWTFGHRIAGDVEEIAAEFLLRPLAQPALVLWREIRLSTHIHTVTLENQLLGVSEVNMWDLWWHDRHLYA